MLKSRQKKQISPPISPALTEQFNRLELTRCSNRMRNLAGFMRTASYENPCQKNAADVALQQIELFQSEHDLEKQGLLLLQVMSNLELLCDHMRVSKERDEIQHFVDYVKAGLPSNPGAMPPEEKKVVPISKREQALWAILQRREVGHGLPGKKLCDMLENEEGITTDVDQVSEAKAALQKAGYPIDCTRGKGYYRTR